MALSDREQELLDQLEQQLKEDPAFSRQMPASAGQEVPLSSAFSGRNLVLGALLLLLGLGIVLLGVANKLIWLGLMGFLVAGGGIYYATARPAQAAAAPSSAAKSAGSSDFMRKLEDRWDERQGR